MTTTQGTTPAAAPAANTDNVNGRRAVTVLLQEPIKRTGGDVTRLQLMRPRVGDLRGLSLSELLTCQADAIATLLPRISVPTLIRQEVDALDPADFVSCGAEVVDFDAAGCQGYAGCIEELMADVAYLLHWPPAAMEPMELTELIQWRGLAVSRHNAVHAPPDKD